MASAFENRLRRTIEMAGTDGQTGPVPVMATPSATGVAELTGTSIAVPRFGGVVPNTTPPEIVDLVIYGATPSGLMAAMAASQGGLVVAVIEPTQHIGGMTTSGLAQTDYKGSSYRHMSPLTSEFYRWAVSFSGLDYLTVALSQWPLPTRYFSQAFRQMIQRYGVSIYTGYRIKASGSVVKKGPNIQTVTFEKTADATQTVTVRAREWIDATYEMDLGKASGASYSIGREASSLYSETTAGVRAASSTLTGVDPYVIPGDAGSGLLFGVEAGPLEAVGTGDSRIQAFCLRPVMTNIASRRLPMPAPAGDNPEWFELLRRYMTVSGGGFTGLNNVMTRYSLQTNGDENWNQKNPLGLNFPGQQNTYHSGTYAQRDAVSAMHREYTKQYFKFLMTDPSVPAVIRTEMLNWGPLSGEFDTADGLPPLMYVREGPRLSGQYQLREQDCTRARICSDPIVYGVYPLDMHDNRYVLDGGVIKTEGYSGSVTPGNRYYIDRRVMLPKSAEVDNMQVTTCVSSTHSGWASVRVEPVLQSLGEAAGHAVAMAIQKRIKVSEVTGYMLREKMQWLDLRPTNLTITGSSALTDGTVQTQANGTIEVTGAWNASGSSVGFGFAGSTMFDDGAAGKGAKKIKYKPTFGAAGRYEIRLHIINTQSGSKNQVINVKSTAGVGTIIIDLANGDWNHRVLGVFDFAADGTEYIEIDNTGTTGTTRANAVDWRRVDI